MTYTTPDTRRLERADRPFSPGRRHGNFAREITLAEFGPRNGRALDQADFTDRLPGLAPFGKIAGRIVQRLAEEREVQNGSR